MRQVLFTAALSSLVLVSCQSTEKPKNSSNHPVSMGEMVPGQSETEGDQRISQDVRKAIIANQGLSIAAKNIVIATSDGVVHLRGRVTSEDEKQEVARIAKGVNGVRQIVNHLVINK